MEPGYSSANMSIDYQFIALVLNVEYVVKKHNITYLRKDCRVFHCRKTGPDKEKQITALKLVTQKLSKKALKMVKNRVL